MLGSQTNFGFSGVRDGSLFFFRLVCLSTTTLFNNINKFKSVYKRLRNQYNSITSTSKANKITTGKLSSWETYILFKNFMFSIFAE